MIDRGTISAVQFGGARHTVRIPAAELVRLPASPKPAAGGRRPLASGRWLALMHNLIYLAPGDKGEEAK
jgi:hypothetical protein